MGVDFYACDDCGETFPDCGPNAICEDCDKRLCPDCMNKYDVGHSMAATPNIEGEDDFNEDRDVADQCPFCSAVAVSDDMLLAFALQQLNVSKDSLTEQYRAAKCKE